MLHSFRFHALLGAPASRRPTAGNRNFRAKNPILAIFRFFRQRAAETAAFPGQIICGIRRPAGSWIEEYLYKATPQQSAGETPDAAYFLHRRTSWERRR